MRLIMFLGSYTVYCQKTKSFNYNPSVRPSYRHFSNFYKLSWEKLQKQLFSKTIVINLYNKHLSVLFIYFQINSKSVSRFNSDTKKWIQISKNRPLFRIDYSTICSLNGCLYEIGGMSRQDGSYLKTAMKFDLSTNTWNYIPCMKYARKNAGELTGSYYLCY